MPDPCAEFVGRVAFSLSGYNPHGSVADGVSNAVVNRRLLSLLTSDVNTLPKPPAAIVDSFSFDSGSRSWLEKGFSLLYPVADVGSDDDGGDGAGVQAAVLRLALQHRQSGVFRYDVIDPVSYGFPAG